jgi:hypothetical protein
MAKLVIILIITSQGLVFSQGIFPHVQAHAHNDYEQPIPLWDALRNGFTSVEADVHLIDGKLKVSHDRPQPNAKTLEQLYLKPLDSLLKLNGDRIYPAYTGTFYLMIDIKTEAESTLRSLEKELARFESLLCTTTHCPVKIFISGNRAVSTMLKKGYQGIALDGRPGDLGKGIPPQLMPIISDNYSNWSKWKGTTEATPDDLLRIRDLAQRAHAEGKKLRLWAIPDNEKSWEALLNAGVDFINTDLLEEFHQFLMKKAR